MTENHLAGSRTVVFPEVQDLSTVMRDLTARVEALEAAQPNYPAKPDSSSASASSLVDRLASVGVSRFYVKAAIREVAAWLVDQHIDSDGCIQSDVGCVISQLREEAGPTLSQEV